MATTYTDHVSSGPMYTTNFYLYPGDTIYSLDGDTKLTFQKSDGNFVLYYRGNALWATATNPDAKDGNVQVQWDGNLVVYDRNGNTEWVSDSYHGGIYAPTHLVVSNEKVAYLLNNNMQVIWSTDTNSIYPTFAPPTISPTQFPTHSPILPPTKTPTLKPTSNPTFPPTTNAPTLIPTSSPTLSPTSSPTNNPTLIPTSSPTLSPTSSPTNTPTLTPTSSPTFSPTHFPTNNPTSIPTSHPTISPTVAPTIVPTLAPTVPPTTAPTLDPTDAPTHNTRSPTSAPTYHPTFPTEYPSAAPSNHPTLAPTMTPTLSWDICLDNIECEYIAMIKFNIEWSVMDEFGEYLSALNGVMSIMMNVIQNELTPFISVYNMWITISLNEAVNADTSHNAIAIVMAATNDRHIIESLFGEIDTSDNMVNKLSPILTENINTEYPESSFTVTEIDGEITIIKPDQNVWDTDPIIKKKGSVFGSIFGSMRYIVTVIGAILLLLFLLLCCVCVYMKCNASEDKVERKPEQSAIWVPHGRSLEMYKHSVMNEYSDDESYHDVHLVEQNRYVEPVPMKSSHHHYNIDL